MVDVPIIIEMKSGAIVRHPGQVPCAKRSLDTRMSLSARVISMAITFAASPCGAVDARSCNPSGDWRERAGETVEQAVFFKPAPDSCSASELGLMPLIVIEQSAASGKSNAPGISSKPQPRIVTVSEQGGELKTHSESATVYAFTTDVEIEGIPLRQWTMVWWIAPAAADGPTMAALRMTLDVHGHPIVWEAINPSHKTVGVFVAKSFAAAVRREFGDRDAESQDEIKPPIVADEARNQATLVRVLTDGPAPMGPMVYCDRNGAILTVVCRCMPSQVDQVMRNENYRVVRLDSLAEIDHLLTLSGDAQYQQLLEEWRRPIWFVEALRWPKEF